MNYDESTGYAHSTSDSCAMEAYFRYKNGKVTVEMREYIYENDGIGIKIERKITGNKI